MFVYYKYLYYFCSVKINNKNMSQYYKINDLKVRVSDHEPNFSMDRFRGTNDIELYTKSADNRKLSVIAQIESYCDKHDMNIADFSEIINDYPDEETMSIPSIKKEIVTAEFIEKYRSISGKGSMKKQDKLCKEYGYNSFLISQGYYILKNKE